MTALITATLQTFRRYGGVIALSGATQAVSSLTNFGVVTYLVRILNKNEFGRYSLGFAAYLFIAAVISALFAVQYVVNKGDRPADEQPSFAMHYLVALLIAGSAIISIALIVELGLVVAVPPSNELRGMCFSVALTATFFAMRDMATRIAFVKRREKTVFISAVVVAVSTVLAFLILWVLSAPITAPFALAVAAFSQFAGGVFILAALRLPWGLFSRSCLLHVFADAWRGGRWHALTSVVYSLRTQAHNFIILPFLGLAALAEVNATRVLLTPAMMAIPSIYQVLMPRLAERGEGRRTVRAIWSTVGCLVGFAAVYSLLLMLNIDWALHFVLGAEYVHLKSIVVAWSVVTILMAARNGLNMWLEIGKAFRALFRVNASTAVAAIALSAGLSMWAGKVGAVWALAFAEALLCVMLFGILTRSLEDKVCRADQVTAENPTLSGVQSIPSKKGT